MLQEMIILGAKRSVGDYNGRPYDSTKIYIKVDLNEESGEMVGTASEEYKWGDSSNFEKLKGLSFPLKAKVDMRLVSSGKSSYNVVKDVQPMASTTTSKNG